MYRKIRFIEPTNKNQIDMFLSFFGIKRWQTGYYLKTGYSGKQKNNTSDIYTKQCRIFQCFIKI